MSPELAAILLIIVVHLVGGGALIWALVREDGLDWRSWWPDDGEGGSGPPRAPVEPPPLPDADPSPRRLRGPDPVAIPRRRRRRKRPQHAPVPQRAPSRRARA